MVRRLKSDVLAELPAKRRQVIALPTDGAVRALGAEAKAWAKQEERLVALERAVAEAALLDDAAAYAEAVARLGRAQSVAFTEMAEVRHAVALAKVPAALSHIVDAAEQNPIVVFAHHRDVIEALRAGLEAAGHRVVQVVGGMSAESKQAAVDAFQAGQARVFLGNIQAAGVGLTLTAASHVVFVELDWVPANVQQAEDRCHRIGQRNAVLVQHLVLDGSLDQRLAQALVAKADLADQALDRDNGQLKPGSTVDVVTLTEPVEVAHRRAPERVYSSAEIEAMLHKLQQLAAVCDGASKQDHMGFNRLDARFGHALARQSTLTQRQAAAAERMLVKYRRQVG